MAHPTPRLILETLLPALRVTAAYAHQVQPYIAARPDKAADNFFGAALSDADLSVQTFIEVALLGAFPSIRFYGEEHERSYNTKYFRAIDLGEQDDYLVTLDPIDGTQFYLDGHSNYQIILGVLNRDDFEAVIAVTPAQKTYCYALRGQGCWQGQLEDNLEDCQPLRIQPSSSTIFLGWKMADLAPLLIDRYSVISVATDYSTTTQIPNVNGILTGELAGVVIRKGQFIDGAALAFLAREAGGMATLHDGSLLPPLDQCNHYQAPGLIIASSPTVHQDLVEAIGVEQEQASGS
jgi:myo-inositol-1(or 4)-monophosphatase